MSRVPKVKWHRSMFRFDGLCWYCGKAADTIDHAKPRSRKGTNKDDNLLPACFACNNLKSDSTVAEFRRLVREMVCRNLVTLGYWRPFVNRELPIVFYGEGNPTPFRFISFSE